ncbi:amidohydrolase family protein [uncultured Arthrobacter sp.]|uniref:N-acyl-D-amino-acid deacylase family protein n=1 Tax=uncultured Arthrobacter sp. TaxID=114050 RepID=UPI002622F1A5|nr:amidohydrolase family protein [uncultured Arthrobacter sp.]
MTNSYLLRGGTVFSGVSPHRSRTDVRIAAGRITEVGASLPAEGSKVVDVEGLWVTPGFIDAHSHADAAALTGEGMDVRALSGVTTEIVGQDGLGLSFAQGSAHQVMADSLGAIVGQLPEPQFSDTEQYLSCVDRGAFARVATLVPHGAVRATVMGRDLREAMPKQRTEMRRLLAVGMAQGAVGVSTGLTYAPALAASTQELIDVTSGLPADTPYVTHLRSYGAGLDESIDEAFDICTKNSLSLHLSHFHVSGPGRAGSAEQYLQRFQKSSRPVTWDTYPYTAGCTFIGALLPASVQSNSVADLAATLSGGAAASLARELDAVGPGPTVAAGWEAIHIAGLEASPLRSWNYRSVTDIAEEANETCGSIILRVFLETAGNACILVNQGHPDNIRDLASAPEHMVGSDGIFGAGMPHPRVANSFFRFLDWANRGVLPVSVEDMVAKMSARTAERFALGSGRLAPGQPADVLVIQPDALEEGPEMGQHRPRALYRSFIGGEPVVVDGSWQGPKLTGLAARRRSLS